MWRSFFQRRPCGGKPSSHRRSIPDTRAVRSFRLREARRLVRPGGTVPRTLMSRSLRFFFQAEAGIRGLTVTGVQTCALPIFAEGLEVGDNTRAAVIARGLAELTRLGMAMGGEPATLAGLAGMGDLVVTCISPHSRNRSEERRVGEESRSRRSPYYRYIVCGYK